MFSTKMIENHNKIKKSVWDKIFLPLYILPFFARFFGLTDQKKAGSRFFLISVDLHLCPRWSHEEKKNFSQNFGEEGNFLVLGGLAP